MSKKEEIFMSHTEIMQLARTIFSGMMHIYITFLKDYILAASFCFLFSKIPRTSFYSFYIKLFYFFYKGLLLFAVDECLSVWMCTI